MSTLDQVISGAEFIQEDEKQDFYLDHDAEKMDLASIHELLVNKYGERKFQVEKQGTKLSITRLRNPQDN